MTGGVIRARAQNKRTLHFVATETSAGGIQQTGLYELDGQLQLNRVEDPEALAYQSKHAAIVPDVLLADAASAIFVDDQQRRWRIPRGSDSYDIQSPLGATRACREVATERDLFNAYGTFFELPAENAGGFAKIRAVATHNLRVHDYCSYRGLLVMSGVARSFPADNPHLIRSNDGRAALWVGAIDDIWKLGKPRGYGGPWKETRVEARVPSDPYLATGYDRKTMTLSHDAGSGVRFHIEYDLTGTGHWIPYRSFEVPAGESIRHEFPGALTMYWIRAVAETGCRATCQLVYE